MNDNSSYSRVSGWRSVQKCYAHPSTSPTASMSTCRPVYQPTYLSADLLTCRLAHRLRVQPQICQHVYLSTRKPVFLSTCLPADQSICLPVYQPTSLPVYNSSTCLPADLSTFRFVCLLIFFLRQQIRV